MTWPIGHRKPYSRSRPVRQQVAPERLLVKQLRRHPESPSRRLGTASISAIHFRQVNDRQQHRQPQKRRQKQRKNKRLLIKQRGTQLQCPTITKLGTRLAASWKKRVMIATPMTQVTNSRPRTQSLLKILGAQLKCSNQQVGQNPTPQS